MFRRMHHSVQRLHSLALLEGMSLGIPAVVSDFGGNPGVIKNGQNGYIVPKQNSKALAE